MNIAHYSLILITPTIERLDSVVAGAVFRHEHGWDVRIASNAQKMKAIDPSFPDGRLVQTGLIVQQFAEEASSFSHLRSAFEGSRLGLLLDSFEGTFTYASEGEYQQQVGAVLMESVNPPSLGTANAAPISRRRNVVRRKLRDHFKARGIWSRNDLDIDKHRVVEQFAISPEHGLFADFALKNGVMHITETIDFEVQSLKGKRLEAQAKSFVLTEAVNVFGPGTKRYVVAAGSGSPEVKQSVLLLSDNALVFALESAADMKSYVDSMTQAAGSVQAGLNLP